MFGFGFGFGFERMTHRGREQIRQIVSDRVEKARRADTGTLSYDPASRRRYSRNSDSRIQILDATHARHVSPWRVVMKTNVNLHRSAVDRCEHVLQKRERRWFITRRRRIE